MSGEARSQAVLITGCSSGIGRATALRLLAAGRPVFATARRPETIADLAQAGCRTIALDVLDEESMALAVAVVEAAHGAVGALVNNAGHGRSGAVEAVAIDDLRGQYETNVLGPMRLAQLVLPGMRAQGHGRIVNVSSVAGRVTMPGAGVYSSSKFALEALSDALRHEVRGFGVRVVVIEPGPIRSGFTATANAGIRDASPDGAYGAYHEAVATADAATDESRLAGTPEQVARAIERAITAARPRARYRVTPIARLLPILRRALRDRGFDAFLRTQAEPPGPAETPPPPHP